MVGRLEAGITINDEAAMAAATEHNTKKPKLTGRGSSQL